MCCQPSLAAEHSRRSTAAQPRCRQLRTVKAGAQGLATSGTERAGGANTGCFQAVGVFRVLAMLKGARTAEQLAEEERVQAAQDGGEHLLLEQRHVPARRRRARRQQRPLHALRKGFQVH